MNMVCKKGNCIRKNGASTSESLRTQAQQLVQAVEVFKLGNEGRCDAHVVEIEQGKRVTPPAFMHGTEPPRLTASGG